METILQDLRYGARSLLRTPGFSFTSIAVLALAIAANSAFFSVLEAVFLHPLPYRDASRLAMLWKSMRAKQIAWDWGSGPLVLDWCERNSTFQDLVIFLRPEASQVVWSTTTGPERIQGAKTTAGFFELLAVSPQIGRSFSREESRRGDQVVIVSHKLWQRRFLAAPDILGRTLSLDGVSFKVIGVMPPEFQLPDPKTELWLPLESDPRWALWKQQKFRVADAFAAIGRLKPGVSMDHARVEMDALSRVLAREHPDTDAGLGVHVVSLADQIAGPGLRRSLALLECSALCVLLIACSNIASLLAVRTRGRRRELNIRSALGASRGRILRQLTAENLLLFLVGGLLGLLASAWGLKALLALAPPDVPRLEAAGMNFTVVAFSLGLTLLSGVIFGVLPSLGTFHHRRWLVTLQFALAVTLLGSAGLLLRSFQLLQAVNPGFDTGHLLTMLVELPASRYRNEGHMATFINQAVQNISALPGVRGAAAGSANIGIFSGQAPVESIVTADRLLEPDFQKHQRDLVSDRYFQLMGIPLLQGRLFSAADVRDGPAVAVINHTMAKRFWPGQNPIGKRFKEVLQGTGGTYMTVVGVVGDVSRNRDGSVEPTFYWSIRQWALNRIEFVVRADTEPGRLVAAVREAVRSTDPSLPPFDVKPVRQQLRELDGPRRFQTLLLAIFAGCALLLAAVGMHGLMSASVEQRTREIGIRRALGATAASVTRVVLREGILCAVNGAALGLFGTVAAGRALSAWLFGITASDLPTLCAVIAVLAFVMLGVSSIAALRSIRVDPIIALRHE